MRDYADIVREFRDVLAIVECGSPFAAATASERLPKLTSELMAVSRASMKDWTVAFWRQGQRKLGYPRLVATVKADSGVAAVALIRTYYGNIELDEVEAVLQWPSLV